MFDIEIRQSGQSIRFSMHKHKKYKEAKKMEKQKKEIQKQSSESNKESEKKKDNAQVTASAPPQSQSTEQTTLVPVQSQQQQTQVQSKKEDILKPTTEEDINHIQEITIELKNLKVKGKAKINLRKVWLRIYSHLKKYKFSINLKTKLFDATIET